MSQPIRQQIFHALTDARATGADLPPEIRAAEPDNFMRHVSALSLTKMADGLLDPKLVLSWVLAQGGAPAAAIGLLVPIREAGALLPQMLTAPHIARLAERKWAWVLGSVMQGAAAGAICLAAWGLRALPLAVVICLALAVLAVARSICSVSYKDVLGRTIAGGRRGTVTGLAGSLASGAVLVFAAVLLFGPFSRWDVVLLALGLAALFWIAGGWILAGLREPAQPGETVSGRGARAVLGQFRLIGRDRRLAHFILTRGLLTATALAPPYVVLLAGGESGAMKAALGAMVLASALAGLVSAYVWGRLADRSSRWVMVLAGVMGALGIGLALGFAALGLIGQIWAPSGALFLLMLAHQGVRIGRSTYLVDMAPEGRRSDYTAVANTVIGVILLLTGGIGALVAGWGAAAVLGLYAVMALCAAAVGWSLPEARAR